ncbi:MAG: hypothetical protein V3S62_07830 [Acidimicrobiia bacterium]
MGSTGRNFALGMVLLLVVAACGDDAADAERFCELNAEIEQADDFFELSPDEARVAVGEARGTIDEMVKVAPEEIAPSIELLAAYFVPILDLFEAADFDSTRLDDGEIDAAFDAAFTDETDAASDTLDAWVDTNCTT